LADKVLVIEGLGLHTGRRFALNIMRAQKPGVQFRTTFEGFECSAPALWTRLSGTARSTALVLRGPNRRKVELRTIEHFMAAVVMSGLTHLDVEIVPLDGENEICEIPGLDGSALEWMRALESHALNEPALLPKGREAWLPVRSIEIQDANKRVVLSPHPLGDDSRGAQVSQTLYTVQVDYGARWKQEISFAVDWLKRGEARTRFIESIAPARTFGFEHEIEHLRSRGLIKGASLENALLLNDERIVNSEGFRVESELAAHKLIDAVGDFALLGAPLLGHILCVRAGHSMHLQSIKEAVQEGALVKGLLTDTGEFIRS
jgi:UDP-3-O-[3-hydroxymyristoyl] N-acetylglucosamine deacetylase